MSSMPSLSISNQESVDPATIDNHHTKKSAPPPGSSYGLNARIPFIGRQMFRLQVHNEMSAHLSIDGAMSVDATIEYDISPDSGAVSLILPDLVNLY